MKNSSTLIIALLFSFIAFAQAPANKTVYDCVGNSENIYATLATGKSIIILHKGVDCSICRNSAPGWQTWAAANTGNVEVWCALTYTYSQSQFNTSNMCQKTASWKSTYNWTDIFTFPDSAREWVNGGSPRYYVYSAIDSTIVYQGANSSIARNMALAQSTVGLSSNILSANGKVYFDSRNLRIENVGARVNSYSIFNTNGQLVNNGKILNGNATVAVENLGKGIFVVQFSNNEGKTESKKLIFY